MQRGVYSRVLLSRRIEEWDGGDMSGGSVQHGRGWQLLGVWGGSVRVYGGTDIGIVQRTV